MSNKRKVSVTKPKNNIYEIHDIDGCYQQLLEFFRDNGVDRIQELAEQTLTDNEYLGRGMARPRATVTAKVIESFFKAYLLQSAGTRDRWRGTCVASAK